MRPFLLAASSILLLSTTSFGAPVTLKLDPTNSALHARTHKAGVASGLAHNHIIAASEVAGTVTFDPEARDTFSVEVTVQTATLKADDARLRHQYGLDGEIDADDRATIEEHMKDEEQLHVKRHPTIRFVSTAVKAAGPGRFTVEGDLTLRGKTRRVSLPVEVSMSAKGFEGTGRLRIKHTWFGFEPYSAMLGAVQNQDKLDLMLKIVATP